MKLDPIFIAVSFDHDTVKPLGIQQKTQLETS